MALLTDPVPARSPPGDPGHPYAGLMRIRITWFLALSLIAAVALAGCGDDDDDGGESNGPWSQADLERLRASTVPGYTSDGGRMLGTVAVVDYASPEDADGTSLHVTVRLDDCDPFSCYDLATPIGPTELDNLKSNLPRVHIDNPDLVFQHGRFELAPGYEGFSFYSRSFVKTEGGRSSAHGLDVIYHDGQNNIGLKVFARGQGSPESEADLLAEMTEQEAGAAAREVFAAFAGEFDRNA